MIGQMTSTDPQQLPYDEQIADLDSKLAYARQKVTELEAELDWWQRGRDLYGQRAATTSAAPGKQRTPGTKPTLAQAIGLVMEAGLPELTHWTAPEVMERLRANGWMPNGKNAEHTVRSKLGQLAREDGSLRRVGHGVYTLGNTTDPTELTRAALAEVGDDAAIRLEGVA
jgi:hypothetical protein